MLTDAQTILIALETNLELSVAERNQCTTCAATITTVLGDLNAQNIVANAGRRNADVTNLHDQGVVPLIAVDNSHAGAGGTELSIYDALDRVNDAMNLISRQVGQDDVTY